MTSQCHPALILRVIPDLILRVIPHLSSVSSRTYPPCHSGLEPESIIERENPSPIQTNGLRDQVA